MFSDNDSNRDYMSKVLPWPIYTFVVRLSQFLRYLAQVLTPPPMNTFQLFSDVVNGYCVYVALYLGIPDILDGKALTVEEIASLTGTRVNYLGSCIVL